MAEDILDKLKSKEEEMEALLNDARKKASLIKDGAVKKAKEIRNIKIREMEGALEAYYKKEKEAVASEVEGIEKEARLKAEELKRKGEARKDKAVAEVIRFIREGIGESR